MHGGVEKNLNGWYVGIDRRRSRPVLQRHTLKPTDLAGFAVALVLVGLVLPAVLTTAGTAKTLHAQSSLRTAWSVLFVCSGLLRLIRWRLTGEARVGLVGCAMFCFGLLSATTPALSALIHDTARDVRLTPVTRSIAVAACLVLLLRTFRSAPVNTRMQPIRVVSETLAVVSLTLAALIAFAQAGHPVVLDGETWFGVGAALAVGWLVLGVHATISGFRGADASLTWIGLGLLVLATAELLHAAAFVAAPEAALYATCLHLVVGALAVVNSARDLGVVFSTEGNALLELRGALVQTEQLLDEEEQLQEERLHDARSLIAALKAASLTLDRYDERLDNAVKHRLRSSLVSELARLERVIDGRRKEPLQVFRLDVALMPVLAAERENGLTIANQLGSIKAKGRPVELATVVQNLLVNARNHAPGSPVRVRATTSGDRVQIFVEDSGPGVSTTEHERVFERGFRADVAGAGEGSGLGLYLARRLMREQGGEIVLRDRDGGGASFSLSMLSPSAEEPRAPAGNVERVAGPLPPLATRPDNEVNGRRRLTRRRNVEAT